MPEYRAIMCPLEKIAKPHKAGTRSHTISKSLAVGIFYCVPHMRTCFPTKPSRWQQLFTERSLHSVSNCCSENSFVLSSYLILNQREKSKNLRVSAAWILNLGKAGEPQNIQDIKGKE